MRTKLSERNMFNVMGKINTFFKKDVMRVKDSTCHYMDDKLTYYPGYCTEHKIRKDMREAKKLGKKYFLESNVLLSICQEYSYNVIPLFPGDIVEITGSKMVLQTSVDGTFFTKTFIQKEVTEEDKMNLKRSALGEHLMWFCDDSMWLEMIASSYRFDAIRLRNGLSRKFHDCICQVDLSQSGKKVFDISTTELDCFTFNDVEFQLEVNLDAINERNINESLAILLKGNKVYDIFAIVAEAFRTESDSAFDEDDFE